MPAAVPSAATSKTEVIKARPGPRPAQSPRLPARQAAADPSSPSQPVQSDGVASPPVEASIDPSWQGQLGAWLQVHKSYPESARERQEEGSILLHFTVAHDGRVTNVELARSSNLRSLDSSAVAMLLNARVPPLPASMPQTEISVTVTLRYSLER